MLRTVVSWALAAVAVSLFVGNAGGASPVESQHVEFINSWLVAGPFDNAADAGMAKDSLAGEAAVLPVEGQAAGGQAWRFFDDRVFSRNYDDYQDLFSFYHIKLKQPLVPSLAYAHVWVWSDRAQNAVLHLGCDTHAIAWLNGKKVVDVTDKTGQREAGKAAIQLQSGWNRLLLKIGNGKPGRLGFYARIADVAGQAIPELQYSLKGGGPPLNIGSTMQPDGSGKDMLPAGFRAWPYVGATVDIDNPVFSPLRQQGNLISFRGDLSKLMRSSDYRLMAEGGTPPYCWMLGDGELPPGLSLTEDGRITGMVAESAPIRNYRFQAWVFDGAGSAASRTVDIPVRERPNRWYEQARLGALVHAPWALKKEYADDFMGLMKRQGYGLVMPITWNNGDLKFQWPCSFAKPAVTDDVVERLAVAARKADLRFGMYMGNLVWPGNTQFDVDEQNLVLLEAIERYRPAAFWFDWAGLEGESLDALYSVIKSASPDTIIILNGHIKGTQGDWDMISFEGWGAWGEPGSPRHYGVWPEGIPWPKKHAPETWRLAVDGVWPMGGGSATRWDEFLRVQLSLIGEGFVANMDHTALLHDNGPPPASVAGGDTVLMKLHRQMADWANPPGMPPLYSAYTNVDPAPLEPAFWGYSTINTTRDAIYLIIMKNPQGKTGLPDDPTMTVGPLVAKVKSVTCMNDNRPLPFEQRGTRTDKTLTISLKGVQQDMVATIIRIALVSALVEVPVLAADSAAANKPDVNIAAGREVRLLSADGKRPLGPSANQMAKYAVDGDLTTSAAAGGEYAWSLWMDLQRLTALDHVVVNFRADGYATQFNLLGSVDNQHWAVLGSREGKGKEPNEFKFEKLTPARFLRVQAVKPDDANQPGGQMSITELQVYAGKLPAQLESSLTQQALAAKINLALGRPAKLLSVDGARELQPAADNVAPRGVDGDLKTAAEGAGDWAWMYQVDLEKSQTIGQIAVQFLPKARATQFKVLISTDAKEWKEVADKKADDAGPFTITLAQPIAARYVAVRAVKPDGPDQPGAQMAIAELQVYSAAAAAGDSAK